MSVRKEICDWAMEDNRYQVIMVAALPYIVILWLDVFAPGYILSGFKSVYKWNLLPEWMRYLTPAVLALHILLCFQLQNSRGIRRAALALFAVSPILCSFFVIPFLSTIIISHEPIDYVEPPHPAPSLAQHLFNIISTTHPKHPI